MNIPSYLKGEGLKTHAVALIIGAVATVIIGFTWGGWVRGSTAQKLANDKVNAEIVTLYTPQCVRHFEAQADMPAHWAALKKASADYDQQSFIEKAGFATPPGAKSPNDDVADACASKLTAALKKMPQQQAKTKS
jgi:alpha/beta superfamily hydrolase